MVSAKTGLCRTGVRAQLLLASCVALNGVASLHGLTSLICTMGRKAEPSHTSTASEKPGEHREVLSVGLALMTHNSVDHDCRA